MGLLADHAALNRAVPSPAAFGAVRVWDTSGRRKVQAVSRYGTATALVLSASWLGLLLADITPTLPLLTVSLAVVASAFLCGLGPGLVATALASFVGDYALWGPNAALDVRDMPKVYTLAGFVVLWLGTCFGVAAVHRRARHERVARFEAEQAAAQADRFAQLAATLGRARSSAAVIEESVQESLHALRADAGMLLLVREEPCVLSVARAVAYEQTGQDLLAEVPCALSSPMSEALRREAPVIVESGDSWKTSYPDVPEAVRLATYESTVAVPVHIGARVVAVVRLDFREAYKPTACDEEFLVVLGASTGQALDRAWQLEATRKARMEAERLRVQADQQVLERQQTEKALRASENLYRTLSTRTARMHDLTAALSEAVTVDAVALAIVQQGRLLVGATAASVSVLVERGTRFQTLLTMDPSGPHPGPHGFAADEGLVATDAVQKGRPVFVHSWPKWESRYWRSASLAAEKAYRSSATLPLFVEGVPAGVLEFHFSAPVQFDADYEALLVAIAQHCVQALHRSQLYESAQSARKQAEAANRLKDDFLSIVSHELRTPLNAVVGWSSMLRDRTLTPEVTGRAIRSIHDNAMRQAKLIDDLLDASRMLTGRATLDMQQLDLGTLLSGVEESIAPTAVLHKIALTVGRVPAVIVPGDRRRLEQVFFNLLDNALKFTSAGGRITVDATIVEHTVEVRVSDTGAGIAPEFLPYVFDRFRLGDSTPTRSHGGLGLGLTIASRLVEAHGGTLSVHSPGRELGTTFTVALPLASLNEAPLPSPAQARRRLPAPTTPRLDDIHVLVVDDEPDTCDVIACALQTHGARVTQAASAKEAFEMLSTTDVDVLLADIAMPGEDGCSLVRRIRASSDTRIASIPAAAVTAHVRHAEREQALAAGFQCHMAKPVDPSYLVTTVDRLVRPRPEAA